MPCPLPHPSPSSPCPRWRPIAPFFTLPITHAELIGAACLAHHACCGTLAQLRHPRCRALPRALPQALPRVDSHSTVFGFTHRLLRHLELRLWRRGTSLQHLRVSACETTRVHASATVRVSERAHAGRLGLEHLCMALASKPNEGERTLRLPRLLDPLLYRP